MTADKLSLQQLRIFWPIATGPSLTRAAKELGIAQPSLSQQLAKLEETLGASLFDRLWAAAAHRPRPLFARRRC